MVVWVFVKLLRGEFTNELGEDFFGLRELGLDTELGMSALRIPSRLFHGRGTEEGDESLKETEFSLPHFFFLFFYICNSDADDVMCFFFGKF